MPIYTEIDVLRNNPPASEVDAQVFLDSLPPKLQEQLICAVYLGRDHIHSNSLRDDVELSCLATDHIPREDYARILYEKSSCIPGYLESLISCAQQSGFDLNAL